MATQEEMLERDDVKAAMAEARATPNVSKRLRVIETPAGIIIVKSASAAQWSLVITASLDDDKSVAARAMRGLILGTIVFPAKEKVAEMQADYVGLWENPAIVKEVRIHNGHASEAHAKG